MASLPVNSTNESNVNSINMSPTLAPMIPARDNNLQWAQQHMVAHTANYKAYRDYYDGRHVFFNAMPENMWKHPLIAVLKKRVDNLCGRVIDEKLSRLRFAGWDSDNEAANTYLDEYYSQSDLLDMATIVHSYGLIYGDAYGLVWPEEDGAPGVWAENPCETAVMYDAQQEIVMAVKSWQIPQQDDKGNYTGYSITRINIYDLDGVRRYVNPAGGIPYNESLLTPYEGDGYPWEQPNPFDEIPIIHWGLGIEPWDYERSDLHNVVPLQDDLNVTGQNGFLIAHQLAFPQRYMIGLDALIDPQTGEMLKSFISGPDQVWELPEGVIPGQFASADLTQIINKIEDIRGEICRVSSTPSYLMTVGESNFPSGEALKTADAPLLDAIERIQQKFNKAWKTVGRLLCQCVGIDPGHIKIKWQDVTPHSDKEQAETATLKQALNIPDEQLWSEMGYDESQIEEMKVLKAEKEAKEAEEATAAFNRGMVGMANNNGKPSKQPTAKPTNDQMDGDMSA